ncbi:MAG: hypothetical protein ACREH8_03705 [Opitutaceae bacterium]
MEPVHSCVQSWGCGAPAAVVYGQSSIAALDTQNASGAPQPHWGMAPAQEVHL